MESFKPTDFLGNNTDVEVPRHDQVAAPAPNKNISRSEEMDDVEDIDDAYSLRRYKRRYPGRYEVEVLGEGKTKFQIWQEEQYLNGENEWAPFKKWDLAQWLLGNVSQKSMDEFLKLPVSTMCTCIHRRTTNLL